MCARFQRFQMQNARKQLFFYATLTLLLVAAAGAILRSYFVVIAGPVVP
jgi:hypothetical protein